MIAAYLVGDRELLERLQRLPGAVNTGLSRSITQLGFALQRTLRRDDIGDQAPTKDTRSPMSKVGLRFEQNSGTITARLGVRRQNAAQRDGLARARSANVRASLRREQEGFASPTAANAIGVPAGDGVAGLVEPSFLRSALDSMAPAVRDEIEAGLSAAIAR
jgi:hypothetical protein